MRILVVGQVFYPDNFRINDIVKELAIDNEVTVVTGLPDYDNGKIPLEYRYFRKRKEKYFDANIVRVPIIQRRKGPIFRSLNYLSYALSGSIYTLTTRKKFDVVFSFQTSPITMFVPGIVYSKKHKVPSVLYTLDLWPESVKAMNINERSKMFKYILKLSKKIYHAADIVLISSPSFTEYLQDIISLTSDKISYLPQYTDETPESVTFRYNFNQIPVSFIFAGNIGYMQDLEVLIKAVDLIRNERFIVNIVGSGTNIECLKNMVDELNLNDKILFHGRKNSNEMDDIYRKSDICILTLKNEGYIGRTIPGKFQTYLAKSKPIVAAISHDTKKLIEEHNLGLVVESGDFVGLSQIMLELIENPRKLELYSKRSFEFYQNNYTKEIFMSKLNKFIKGEYKNV